MRARSDAYLNTRISAMARRLLSDEDIEAMLQLPASEQASLDGTLGLGPMRREDAPAPGSAVGQRIVSMLLEDLRILLRPLRGNERQFLLQWAQRTELSNFKAILRGKLARRSAREIREDLLDMGPFATLPVEQLLQTEDIVELLQRLENTRYAPIARQVRSAFDVQHDLFAVDATVDRQYFIRLLARARDLADVHGHPFDALMGSVIDRVNLVWLVRYRFAYQLPAAQTFYLLVPSPYRLDTARLSALVRLESLEQVIDALPAPLRALAAGTTTPFEITRRMEEASHATARATLRQEASAFARAFAYLVAREQDLRKVRAIDRARLLQLDPDLTRKALAH
jgi:V/A-type H+-transporting ATPase subunit C